MNRSYLLLVLALAAFIFGQAVRGVFGSDRITEDQAAKIRARNDEIAQSLPVPSDANVVQRTQAACAGAYEHEASEACALLLVYETGERLADILLFYRSRLEAAGWKDLEVDSLRERYFKKDGSLISVAVGVPALTCPERGVAPDAALACESNWISQHGGKYHVHVGPD